MNDNEDRKTYLKDPNLYFTLNSCQNMVQKNKVTVQLFGTTLFAIVQCKVLCLSRIDNEIKVAYIDVHINTYEIYVHIYV